jgi:peptide deformylase
MAREMLELMYEAKGVGLAANQVDLPLRLFVINLASHPDEGEELVFINPVISRAKGSVEQEEGCLSLPGVYGNVWRPKQVNVQAFGVDGKEINATIDGMLARVVQHETDHLNGVLFTDRMSETGQIAVRDSLEEFETDYQSRSNTGETQTDEQIQASSDQWLKKYC